MGTIKDTIKERRTIRTLSDQPISSEQIEEILTTTAFAPFHASVEPWSVVLFQGAAAHQDFTKALLASYDRLQVWDRYDQDNLEEIKQKTNTYFESIPVSMIITTQVFNNQKKDLESVAATSAFIQNIQLAAWEAGIGCTWRTTPNIFDTAFKNAFSIPEDREIIGTLHLTVAAEVPRAKPRQPVTSWIHKWQA